MDEAKLVDELSNLDRRQTTGQKTVQILTLEDTFARTVSELLANDFQILTTDHVRDADLFIVDNRALPTYIQPLRGHVEAAHPVFVPVVVIRQPGASLSVDLSEPVPSNEPLLVNVELERPVTKRVLVRCVYSLLGRRRQSVQNRTREQRIKDLLEATRSIMNTNDREDVMQFTADVTKDILGFSNTVIRLLESDVFVPKVVSQTASTLMGSRQNYPLDPDDNPVARAFGQREPIVYPDFDRLDDGYDRQSAASGMYIPIGEYGVLSVIETEVNAFDRSDVGMASVLAANAKSALDRIEYEQQLERRERTQQIVSRVLRHNIRNSLTTITGYGEILEDELSDNRAQHARTIIDSAESLLKTSTNTHLISQYTGTSETEVRDLATVVDESVASLLERYPSVDVELDVVSPCRARVSDGFSLAVDNLLENAVEHNDAADPWLSVRVTCTEEPTLIVEDNGPGIPDNELQSLESDEEAPLAHLSGTGLWLVKLLVENADGTIAIDETSSGTRATIRLELPETGQRRTSLTGMEIAANHS
ncbi:Signal transduction histidine kinase [Halanaeroarchaeum sp. HSR-CO]|uniref:sensor histidine kinase n=1 Tax=Halanaeroarchaeum sp. HSR-CO TaxID=2866382 RepID=UPI00217EBD36|nr:ATP-binding protein [Halanaeroarchaeum sp. HSR-CO]UWG47643.1 Signal transduction histidine kinase [Halanaeroarchaeum sp. HSR-CO]